MLGRGAVLSMFCTLPFYIHGLWLPPGSGIGKELFLAAIFAESLKTLNIGTII
jgi:hypothetical protein